MKKTISLAFLACLYFSGCSDKNVPHDPLKNEILAYTQKFESVKQGDRYLAIGTYLNPVDVNRSENDLREHFVLLTYPKEVEIIKNSLKVNGDNNVELRKLKDDDEILKLTNFNMPWGNYYEIHSPEKKSDFLTITYNTTNDLNVTLNFRKISKSMYWNPTLKLKDD